MTLYHNSPRTGKAARCRAKIQCLYGTTHGTTIRKDGTVDVGTGGSTWTTMEHPPARIEERIIIGKDGKAQLTYEKPNRLTNTTSSTDSTTDSKKVTEDMDEYVTVEDYVFRDASGREPFLEMKDGYPAMIRGDELMEGGLYEFRADEKEYDGEKRYLKVINPVRHYRFGEERLTEPYDNIVREYAGGASIFSLYPYDEAKKEADEIASLVTERLNRTTFRNPTKEEFEELLSTPLPEPYEIGCDTRQLYTQPIDEETVSNRIMNIWVREQFENGLEKEHTEEQLTIRSTGYRSSDSYPYAPEWKEIVKERKRIERREKREAKKREQQLNGKN